MSETSPQRNSSPAAVLFEQTDDVLCLRLCGDWSLQAAHPVLEDFREYAQAARSARLVFDSSELGCWDSALISYLAGVLKYCRERHIDVDDAGLPPGPRRLLRLAFAVPAHEPAATGGRRGYVYRLGRQVQIFWLDLPAALRFIGEVILSLVAMLRRRRAGFAWPDLLLVIQETGPQALPVVSLIAFLVGLIFAYMGAVQLQQFGAQIYIADLVGIGMVREIGALMTGIIMAGRTAAAYAAQLGSMQVNEELDAFRTLGISPIDYLVVPRVLGLVLMTPLLTLYAGVIGILAGMLIAMLAYDVEAFAYLEQTLHALDLRQFLVGMSKGLVYGIVVALAGCYRGLHSGRSAAAVGRATTSAVVTGIVFIVIAASLMTIVYQRLGI